MQLIPIVSCALKMNFTVYTFHYGLGYCENKELHPIYKIITISQNQVIFEWK